MNIINSFPQKVKEQLKSYVYLYVDPRNGNPFYVGKGKGNRIFSHLKDKTETEKTKVLNELQKLKLSPICEVLKYGLSEHEAFLIESAVIDLLKLTKLTNKVHGHHADLKGRTRVEDLIKILNSAEAELKEPAILIVINQAYRFGMSPQELYDATRSAWRINLQRGEKAKYAMAVYRGIIQEVYTISKWVEGGSTMRFTDEDNSLEIKDSNETIKTRWEFVGNIAETKIRKKYKGKSVSHYSMFIKGARNPIKYWKC